jgi:hypothetical protein
LTSLVPFVSRIDLSNAIRRDLTDDEYAKDCVDAACDMCRTISEQDFNAVDDDEVALDGSGTDALLLPQLPVTEVSDVTLTDEAVTDFKLNGNGVLLRDSPGVWTKGRQNVVVTYSHGYANADLPRDVRMVALKIAERLFSQGAAVFESLGAYSVRYEKSASDLTANELRILHKYRRAK